MSDEITKVKHSKRLHKTQSVIQKRKKLVKDYNISRDYSDCGNKLSKMNGVNCGNPTCVYCMNPRRYGERTLKEKAFDEEIDWE